MRFIKKLSAVTITAIMALFAVVPVHAAETPVFTDVPETHWAYSFVSTAAANGWVTGYGDGRFGPDAQVSYAELSQMLVRAFFSDELKEVEVQDGNPWYVPACTVAEELGLYVGVDIRAQYRNESLITKPVSRYEMAQILTNTMRAAGATLSPNLTIASANTADWNAIPSRYQGAVAATKTMGLIAGTDEAGTFSGDLYMSRSQAATIMVRLNDLIQKGFPDMEEPVITIEPEPTLPEPSLVDDGVTDPAQ